MKIKERIYLVGSGLLGMNQTNDFDCNVYLIDGGDSLMLVDSGAGIHPDAIMQQVMQDGFHPEQIDFLFISHAHADHSGGASQIQKKTSAKIVCSKNTSRILRNADEQENSLVAAKKAGMYPEDYVYHSCEPSIEVNDHDVLQVGDLSLEFLMTPGHSHDSFSCYSPDLKALFSSDVVFERGKIAALSSHDFSIQDLNQSIQKLAGLSFETLLPGHLTPIVRNGHTAVQTAKEIFDKLTFPQSII